MSVIRTWIQLEKRRTCKRIASVINLHEQDRRKTEAILAEHQFRRYSPTFNQLIE